MQQLFATRIDEAAAIHPAYADLWRHIRNITLAGGKRIRPCLVMIGYGEFDDKIIPVAAAQELLHTAMLMHDDIIDQDDLRHGRQNINGVYRELYGQHVDADKARHFSYAAGTLAGDALLSEAYRCLHDAGLSAPAKQQLVETLHTAIFEVIGGELLDVEAGFLPDIKADPLLIGRYKTAGYSFIGPLTAGALCAEADQAELETLRRYGEFAGIAFQLQDDILGIFGDRLVTGKPVLADLREAKHTYLISAHRTAMDADERQRFAATFGNPDASDDALMRLRDDIEHSGARAAAEELTAQYADKALAELSHLQSDDRRDALRALTLRLAGRQD